MIFSSEHSLKKVDLRQTRYGSFFELNRVANLELISEQNNKNKNDLYDLMKIWRNLEVNESYCEQIFSLSKALVGVEILENFSVHDKFHRALVLSDFFFLKIASTFLNSSFFPKPIKRRIAI